MATASVVELLGSHTAQHSPLSYATESWQHCLLLLQVMQPQERILASPCNVPAEGMRTAKECRFIGPSGGFRTDKGPRIMPRSCCWLGAPEFAGRGVSACLPEEQITNHRCWDGFRMQAAVGMWVSRRFKKFYRKQTPRASGRKHNQFQRQLP